MAPFWKKAICYYVKGGSLFVHMQQIALIISDIHRVSAVKKIIVLHILTK
ncbi:MAG: hypothetical protein K0R80_833 [Clostridia bacterium]|nr:hypothetical protein [Clostridia bacterium]